MELGLMLKKWKIIPGLMIAALILIAVSGQTVLARTMLADYDCGGQNAMPEDECRALVAIYNATGGESWRNSTGWLTNSDPCTWHGVSCSEGHVAALDLFNNNLRGNLPIEIGGFPNLQTLTLNDNPLTGPIPITITFMDLDLFHFHGTMLCEPDDPEFQDWFSQIVYRISSGLSCATQAPTQAGETSGGGELSWPQQTLTALAVEDSQSSGISTATPQVTPTRYYTLQTPTRPIVDNSDEADGSFGGMQESETKSGRQRRGASILSNIPTTWLLLLLVPLALIVFGVILEVRDRRQEKTKASGSSWIEFSSKEENEEKAKKAQEAAEAEDDYDDFDMYDFDPK